VTLIRFAPPEPLLDHLVYADLDAAAAAGADLIAGMAQLTAS
jgi:hypothetical protein